MKIKINSRALNHIPVAHSRLKLLHIFLERANIIRCDVQRGKTGSVAFYKKAKLIHFGGGVPACKAPTFWISGMILVVRDKSAPAWFSPQRSHRF